MVRADFHRVVEEKKARIQEVRQTVADLLVQQEEKRAALRQLRAETGGLDPDQEGVVTDLEADTRRIRDSIGSGRVQLHQLMRDLDRLKEESASMVAEVMSPQDEQAVADLLSGVEWAEDAALRER